MLVLFICEGNIKMINIYAIYENDVCLYLGSTSRDVDVRVKEHFKELSKGIHINKTLQKRYNSKIADWTVKLVSSINTDNTTLRYFYECLYNSFLKPKCNRCIIQQGYQMINLQRTTEEQAIALIDAIDKVV